MKPGVRIFSLVLLVGCGSKKEATSCEVVGKKLAELDAGDKATFMTDNERASRAKRWIATCEPMSQAQRKCVLAATSMEAADACGDTGSAKGSGSATSTTAAWVMRAGDGGYQKAAFVVIAPDGDVVAAGDFEGTLDMHGQAVVGQRTDAWVARFAPDGTSRWVKRFGGEGRDYTTGLTLGVDGNALLVVSADADPRFSRVTIAKDGSISAPTPIATDGNVDAAALHDNGDIVLGSRVIEPIKGGACAASGIALHRVAADGKRIWSRCNDGKAEVTLTDDMLKLADGPDGITAVCGGFSGALAWGGKAAPEAGSDERVFVLALDAKGEPRWADYVAGTGGAVCDTITVTDDSSVVAAIVGSGLASWKADGTKRWTRSCEELLGTKEKCEISALTASGSDVVVAAQSGAQTSIATIDVNAGTKKQATIFDEGRARIESLAAQGKTVVFAAGFSRTVNFGTGPLESAAGDNGASMDALVGRL